jgi:hypothetical protein
MDGWRNRESIEEGQQAAWVSLVLGLRNANRREEVVRPCFEEDLDRRQYVHAHIADW